MTPAVAAAPVDEALKLSDADKRILSGVVREKYADLIRRLKDHKSLLERDLQTKLRRGEDSWILMHRDELIAEHIAKLPPRQKKRLLELDTSDKATRAAYEQADQARQQAQANFDAKRDEIIPVTTPEEVYHYHRSREAIIKGLMNGQSGYRLIGPVFVETYEQIVAARDEFAPVAAALKPLADAVRELHANTAMDAQLRSYKERSYGFYDHGHGYESAISNYDHIQWHVDRLEIAVKELAPLARALDKAASAFESADKPYHKAHDALRKFTRRTGVCVDADGELDVTSEKRDELLAQSFKDAEARADKIASVVETVHENSRTFRSKLALSRLESDEAERIVASIPESIDDLL